MEEKEKNKLLKKICRKAGVTIRDTSMLAEGDHVLLGLSGGKDSMVMLELMAERRATLPFGFKLSAAHIAVEGIGYTADLEKIEALCEKLNVSFIHRTAVITEQMNADSAYEKNSAHRPAFAKATAGEKGICFLCSWYRRKALFDLTSELECNKLALGHHRNDAVETLLLNMIYHGSVSSLPYSLEMFDGRMQLIRPMLDLDESLLDDYARIREFGTEGIKCEHERANRRDHIRELLSEIEGMHDKARINMFRAMDKIFVDYLPQKKARNS